MEDKIKEAFEELYQRHGIIMQSNFRRRKDEDLYDESGELVKIGQSYIDVRFSYKNKTFPITFINENNIEEKMKQALIDNKIEFE